MKSAVGSLGLGVLLCAPCLLGALAAGGALAAFVHTPAAWGGELLVVAAAAAFLTLRWRRRRCCKVDTAKSGATSARETVIPRRTDRGA